jgi:hypothetical protein
MIAARLATVAVVLAAAARAFASVDAGAGSDGPYDSAPTADARADAADDRNRDGPDEGADASARVEGGADAAAPTVPLRGQVLQKGTRRPLAGAVITVDGKAAGESGADGHFELRVAPGRHRVQIQTTGHDTADRTVEATAGAPAPVELYRLAPRLTGERYETTVRTGRAEVPQIDVSGEEARAVAGTSGDPLRVLGSLPGVSQVVWPAAIYVVRGANPGNTGFYLDGVRVPALFHIALGPSVIHPYLIGGVDFYPGSHPASFGGYVSGIMAARTTPPPTDRVHAQATVTLYDAGGIMTAPLSRGRGTVAVAARYSYTGALFSLLSADSTLRYGDYQLRAEHPLLGGQATLFAFGSLDELGWRNLGVPEYAALQFHRVDMRWRRALGGGRLLVASTLGADWSRSTLFDRPIRVRALSVMPRVMYDRTVGVADVLLGADANAQDFVAAVPDFGRQPSDLGRSRQALTVGGHATLSLHAGPRLTVAPGVRADLFAEQGVRRTALSPRLDVILQVTDRLALRANGGRFAQMPSLPVSVAGFEAFGLADLGLQTSLAGSLGFEAALPRSLTMTLTGFASQLRLTDVYDIDLTTADPGAPDFLISRRGRAYGAELLVRRADRGRAFGWLAYTLSWSRRQDESGVYGPSDWDQRHILNLVAGYRLRGGISVGARFHYNTGRRAPVVGSGGRYQELPAFYQLDLRAEKRIIFDRFVLSVFADFANVTLTREVVQVVQVASDGTADDERSFRLILPTIGVRAEL